VWGYVGARVFTSVLKRVGDVVIILADCGDFTSVLAWDELLLILVIKALRYLTIRVLLKFACCLSVPLLK